MSMVFQRNFDWLLSRSRRGYNGFRFACDSRGLLQAWVMVDCRMPEQCWDLFCPNCFSGFKHYSELYARGCQKCGKSFTEGEVVVKRAGSKKMVFKNMIR